jgi:hypothetical protein
LGNKDRHSTIAFDANAIALALLRVIAVRDALRAEKRRKLVAAGGDPDKIEPVVLGSMKRRPMLSPYAIRAGEPQEWEKLRDEDAAIEMVHGAIRSIAHATGSNANMHKVVDAAIALAGAAREGYITNVLDKRFDGVHDWYA